MSGIRVTWIAADGRRIEGEAAPGASLMEAALANGVPGVIGECGGALACATCHVVVEHAPIPLDGPNRLEEDMLDFTEVPRREKSRLSCQITAAPELDGLVLRVP